MFGASLSDNPLIYNNAAILVLEPQGPTTTSTSTSGMIPGIVPDMLVWANNRDIRFFIFDST